jgi:hypothetical protein
VESWSHFWWICASLHSQPLLQLVFFQFPHKKYISHFPGARRGQNRCFFCEGATKGIVQNITNLIFMGGGPTRGATARRLGVISACCHIMNYFCPKSIFIQFCTEATKNAHQKNRGKYREVPWGCGTLEPRPNHGSHITWQTLMAPRLWPRSRRGAWGI